MADVYLDMSGEDESGEKCGQEIQKRRFPTYPGEASPSMEGPYLSGKMVEMEAPGVGKRNRTAGINPAGDELQSAAMASKTSLNTHISFGSVSLSGRAREMEDAISVQPGFVQFQDACTPFHFFAVFDGHGGSHVSALCKEMMHSVLAEEIMAEPARGVSSGAEETRWKSAVERCFRRMDRLALSACACGRVGEPTCTCERSGIESDVVGSTAVIAVVGGGRLLIANCGDSRAVLSRGGRTVPLSVDHKPDRPDELARIEAAGGRVIYVNGARVHGILAMSRALGSPTISQNVSFDELTGEDEDEDPCAVGEPDHTARAGSRTDAARGGDAVEAKALASEASAPCIKANAGVGVGEPPLHAIDAGTPATKRLIGPVPAVGENLTANCSSGSLAGPTDSSSVERPSVSKGANAPSEDAAEPP